MEQSLTTSWTSHDQEPISTTIGSLSTAITSHAFDQVRSELRIGSDIADAPALNAWLTGPRVTGARPGPRSADMLARQARRESNPRTYPRDLPIAIDEAAGCWVRDVDGNVFIDFLTGAGVLWAMAIGNWCRWPPNNLPSLAMARSFQRPRGTHSLRPSCRCCLPACVIR